jgi:hypothetical protein
VVALALAAALGCGSPRVRLTAHHAADVQVPVEIRRLGAASPEGEDAAAALVGLRDQLARSPRFVWSEVPSEADALVTVRAVDAVSEVDQDQASDQWTAVRTARVGVSWELRARDGRVLDALASVAVVDHWSGAADTRAEAVTAVIGREEAERSLFWSAGAAYARRISPFSEDTVRALDVRGDRRLRQGYHASRTGDWGQAVRLWSQVASAAPSATLRARADHDLAVAFELRGEPRRALEYVDRSLAARATGRTTRYRERLARSVAEARSLRWVAAPGSSWPGPTPRDDAEDR